MRIRMDFFWHINYPIVGEEGKFVEIATTRPETLLGDTAVAVNPDDERYQHLIGKMLKLPLTDREIPVIGRLLCRQRVRNRMRKDHPGS